MDVVRKGLKETERSISAAEFHIRKKLKKLEAAEKMDLSENSKVNLKEDHALIQAVKDIIEVFRKERDSGFGRMPPCDHDLEETVLGAVLLEKPGLVVTKFLKPEHFHLESHAIIYQAVLDLIEAGNPVDMRSVVYQLKKQGKIELIGGAHAVAEVTARVSSAANIEFHARILIEFAVKRQLILMGSEIMSDGYDDTRDCFQMLDRAKELLNQAEEWRKK